MKQYPFFVYGTLRKGFGNYNGILRGFTVKELEAETKGIIYDTGAFPAMVKGEGTIQGELMYVDPDLYNSILADIDSLEGYHPNSKYSLYTRQLVTAKTVSEDIVTCWIYVWNTSLSNCRRIPSGDWKQYVWESRYKYNEWGKANGR